MLDNLYDRFTQVRQRMVQAAGNAERNMDEIELIAVSKTYPSSAIRALTQYGQYHFGENYIQEWLEKTQELKDLPVQWHVIGPVQSNKTQYVALYAHWLHTLDRLKIAQRLSLQRPPELEALNVCIQVNVSGELSKSGVLPEEVLQLAMAVNQFPGLCLKGLMCLPEDTDDLSRLSGQFAKMQRLLDSLQQAGLGVSALSMGMSADLELAIAYGATHVRVGSAIFGPRQLKK